MKKEVKLVANINFEKKESAKFLLCEYEQSFEHMRHYDNAKISFVKFAFTGYAAIASALFALFEYLQNVLYRSVVIGGILILTSVMGIIILALMVRNRIYFVVVARQVNSLRNYFLNNMDFDLR